MTKYCFWLLLASLLIYSLSLHFTKRLPPSDQIIRYLKTNPEQFSTDEEKFEFVYSGETYLVDPIAEYDLYGLVVSHNNIHSLADAYHDSASVDIKDVCVVWGTNVMSDIYQRAKFSSGAWTCYVNFDNPKDASDFEPTQLSNNHLLSADIAIQKQMKNLHIGDQIHLSGYLVNYASSRYPEYQRKSSLVRNDTGDGACEVFYLDRLTVLKKGNPLWNFIKTTTFYLNFIFGLLFIFVFITSNQIKFQKNKPKPGQKVKFSQY